MGRKILQDPDDCWGVEEDAKLNLCSVLYDRKRLGNPRIVKAQLEKMNCSFRGVSLGLRLEFYFCDIVVVLGGMDDGG